MSTSYRIVEIAIEVTEGEFHDVVGFIESQRIPYYVEPQSKFSTLAELEADCEGK